MAKATEAGRAFWEQVAATLPEDARALITELPEETATLIGEGVLARADYSRVRDAQTKWWDTNQPLVELAQKAKAAGFDPDKPVLQTPGAPAAPTLPDDVIRRDDLDQRESGYAQLMTWSNRTSLQHFKDFGEVLDLEAIANDPKNQVDLKRIGLKGIYERDIAPRYAERQKQATELEIAKRVEAGVAERLKGNPQYPSGKPQLGSPLDALEPAASTGISTDELTDAYNTVLAGGSI